MGARQYPLVGGGSGGGAFAPNNSVPFWSYLKPPASPHAHDDYFDDASIDGAWSEFDPGSTTTITETALNRLKIVQSTHAGDGIAALIRPAPADDEYNVTVGFRLTSRVTNFCEVGLVAIGSDALSAPTTANLVFASLVVANNDLTYPYLSFTAYNAFAATDGVQNDGEGFNLIRFHVKNSADRVAMLLSKDGRDWQQVNDKIFSTAGLTGTVPAYFGPGVNNVNSGENVSGIFEFYQVEITTDRFSPVGGWVDLGIIE